MTTPSFTRRTAIVDAHAHLYDGGANRYGIFARKDPGFEAFVGDYSALPRTYLLDDYLRATSSRKVDGLIWHEFISEDPIKEVTWVQQLAVASEVPIALVGLVDCRAPASRMGHPQSASPLRTTGRSDGGPKVVEGS